MLKLKRTFVYKNIEIGDNTLCFFNKIICGSQKQFHIFVLMGIVYSLTFNFWIIFFNPIFIKNNYSFPLKFGSFVYINFVFFHIFCYFTDPGIIPRNYKPFAPTEESKRNQDSGCCPNSTDNKLTEQDELGKI